MIASLLFSIMHASKGIGLLHIYTRLKTMYLEVFLFNYAFFNKYLAHLLAMVALQLDHFTSLLFDNGAVASKLLLKDL